MAGRVTRALCISAVFQLVAGGVAGCKTSIGDAPTPAGADPGVGDEGGDGPVGGDDEGGDGVGGACAGEPCDLYEQCGCDPGQACDLDGAELATGGTICRAVSSPGQTQSNCSSEDQCAAGYSCLGNPGQCRKVCDEDGDCGAGHCVVRVVFENDQGEFEDVPDARACSKPCTAGVAEGNGCPADPVMGCRVYSYDPDGAADSGDEFDDTDCTAAGTGGDAADCSAGGDDDCLPGFGCYVITYTDDTQQYECRQICVVSIDGVEQTGQCAVGTCNGFADPSTVGDTEYGVCF
jgi:hypothetical protein